MFDYARINVEGDGAHLSIGDESVLNSGAQIFCRNSVTIGVKSGLGFNSLLTDTDFHPIEGQEMSAPVVIEDHVWVGANVTVLKGVTIGKGAMIAAGSVVTNDIPPGMLAAGIPARPIRPIVWEY
jgi:acetyltransferase-like isoleucine patch superfamily enzyme